MPLGVRVFLILAFLLLAFLGLTTPLIVAQAVEAPITGLGLVWMLLLAYLIFTLTLVLQRKRAGYMFALGLASLTLPLTFILGFFAGLPGALIGAGLATTAFLCLRGTATRSWFIET